MTSAFPRRSAQLVRIHLQSHVFNFLCVSAVFLVARLIVYFLLAMGIWLLGNVTYEPTMLLKCVTY